MPRDQRPKDERLLAAGDSRITSPFMDLCRHLCVVGERKMVRGIHGQVTLVGLFVSSADGR